MSSAVYPLGMNSMPASGYTHQSTYYNKQYIPWKGTGPNSFPVGTAPGHIRPLTNNDPGNNFQTGFGLARPIKHYRKGRVIPPQPISGVPNLIVKNPYGGNILNINENALINYNLNRFVKSSTAIPLGGSSSSSGLLNDMLGAPGSYLVKQNTCKESNTNSNNLNNNNWQQVYTDYTNPDLNIYTSETGQYLLTTNLLTTTILVSNDYGNTWTQKTLPNLIVPSDFAIVASAAISSTGQYQVVSSSTDNNTGTLITYYSNDYGNTWVESDITLPDNNGYILFYSIKMTSDGQTVLIGITSVNNQISYLYKSIDNGQTYNSIYNNSSLFILDIANSSDTKYITIAGQDFSNQGVVYTSNNYGSSFTLQTLPPSNAYLHNVMSSNGKYQIVSGFNSNNIYYSDDYGNTWKVNSGLPFLLWNGLTMTGDGSITLALGYNTNGQGSIYISKDYGATWSFLGNPPGVQAQLNIFYYTSGIVISSDGSKVAYTTTRVTTTSSQNFIPPSQIFILNNPNLLSLDCNQSITENCKTCEGIGIVASYKPNTTFLEENPEPNTQNPVLCCNDELKAKRRAIYASTNLNKNYYTTTKQYLQNRCKTYEQKAFNFLSYRTNDTGSYNNNNDNNPYYISVDGNNKPKPGGPLSLANTYLANCQLNAQLYEGSENAFIYQMLGILLNENIITQTELKEFNNTNINSIQGFFNWILQLPEPQRKSAIVVFETFINNPYWGMPPSGPTNPTGCQLTVYKPNNYQYAKQGAVSSSTRVLKLNVDTISTNAASIQNYNNTGPQLVTANELYTGDNNNYTNLLKNKTPIQCNLPWPINFSQSGKYQNKKFCSYTKQLPQYQVPISQPSPYRYFPGTVFNSNHYSQSPNTYNTTTGSAAY